MQLTSPGVGATGWEAFTLDYACGPPCDVVLSASAMAAYRRAFTFLWRLKRVEYSLTAAWRKHCTTARLLPQLHVDPTMNRCYKLRNEMVRARLRLNQSHRLRGSVGHSFPRSRRAHTLECCPHLRGGVPSTRGGAPLREHLRSK